MEDVIDQLPSYYIRISPDLHTVELWSTARLPFEPKGWVKQMRDELRYALQQIRPENNTILQSVYVSLNTDHFDVENVLLYNVGPAYFRNLCSNGLAFGRRIQSPPACPYPLNGEPKHYHRYSLIGADPSDPAAGQSRNLAEWHNLLLPALTQDTKPHVIWALLRHNRVITTVKNVKGGFGLELALAMPEGTKANVAGVIKPLLDGIVSAFHVHDGSNLDLVSQRLSELTGATQSNIESLLMNTDVAILGKTNLVYPRAEGIQWNPADHLCMEGKINITYGDGRNWVLSGRMFEI